MDRKQARDLAVSVLDLSAREMQDPQAYDTEVQVALMAAMDRLPEGVTAAVLPRPNGPAQLAAVDVDHQVLYVLEPVPHDAEAVGQRAKCSVVPIISARCSLCLETSLYFAHGDHWTSTDWVFTLGDLRLEFQTNRQYGSQRMADEESFAVALAEAMGTPVDSPAGAGAPVLVS